MTIRSIKRQYKISKAFYIKRVNKLIYYRTVYTSHNNVGNVKNNRNFLWFFFFTFCVLLQLNKLVTKMLL